MQVDQEVGFPNIVMSMIRRDALPVAAPDSLSSCAACCDSPGRAESVAATAHGPSRQESESEPEAVTVDARPGRPTGPAAAARPGGMTVTVKLVTGPRPWRRLLTPTLRVGLENLT